MVREAGLLGSLLAAPLSYVRPVLSLLPDGLCSVPSWRSAPARLVLCSLCAVGFHWGGQSTLGDLAPQKEAGGLDGVCFQPRHVLASMPSLPEP